MSLTEEQEQFLAECEAQFSARFTEADKDFMKVKEAGLSQPPVIQPWYARQRGEGKEEETGGDNTLGGIEEEIGIEMIREGKDIE